MPTSPDTATQLPDLDPAAAAAWRAAADRLAAWAWDRLAVRRDRWGGYYADADGIHKVTRPAKKRVGQVRLGKPAIATHFRADRPADVVGFHFLTVATEAEPSYGKAVGIDVDNHDDDPATAAANLRFAMHAYRRAAALGFTPLLCTWLTGGYHLWVPVAGKAGGDVLHHFGRWLVADAAAFGIEPPEVNPKNPHVTGCGNWMRAPGRHHKRDVWAVVFDGSAWVQGAAAVEHVLGLARTPADRIPPEAAPPPPEVRTPTPTGPIPGAARPAGVVRERADVFREYNQAVGLDDVVSWHVQLGGHTVISRKADRVEFQRAGKKDAGTSFNVEVRDGVPVTFSFSVNAGMPPQRGLSPSQVRCFYERGNCDRDTLCEFAGQLRREMGWPDPPARSPRAVRQAAAVNPNDADPPIDDPSDGPADDERDAPEPNEKPDDPHRLAYRYLAAVSPDGPPFRLRYWRGEFHRYTGSHYRPVPDDDMRARLTRWADREFTRLNRLAVTLWEEGDRKRAAPEKRPVTRTVVSNLTQAVEGACLLPASIDSHAWVDGVEGPDPASLLPAPNGIIDLAAAAAGRADCLLAPSPSFFTPFAVGYEFRPDPPPPNNFLGFLADQWGDDPESVDCLQEWFGYLLTADTSLQKILFVIGPPRGGKGTIARVLAQLVGAANVVTPKLATLAGPFGLEPLLNKSVAIVTDARLSGRHDAVTITEAMLSISGEDTQTVSRKHRSDVVAKLPLRFVLMSNLLPRLTDASGAFANRLIVLRMKRSFRAKPDPRLFDRIRQEMPGILAWSIRGLKRLRERGNFLEPESAQPLKDQMKRLSASVGGFIEEKCVVGGPDLTVPKAELYKEWVAYCTEHGIKEPGTDDSFGRDLFASVEDLGEARPRVAGKPTYHYTGIRLRHPYDPDPDDSGHSPGVGHTEPTARQTFPSDDGHRSRGAADTSV